MDNTNVILDFEDIVLDTKQTKAILIKIQNIEANNKNCLQKAQYQDCITAVLRHPIKKCVLKRYINRLKQNDDDIQILLQRYCSIVEKFEK